MSFRRAIAPLVWLSIAPWLVQALPSQQPRPVSDARLTVRVHHLHFRVGDPAAAMQEFAGRFGGSRVLLQGLGVGVRVGSHFLLFDRDRGEARAGAGDIESAYRAAVPWLVSHGLFVQAGDLAELPIAALSDAGLLDHMAFAAADYGAAIVAVVSRGAQPFRRTDDAAMFRLPDGTPIELVKDTDVPDAFWCPMHMDVRSGTPGKCPICGMELVAIPPPRIGEYRMDVTPAPGVGGRGLGGLRIVIRDPETGKPVPAFATVHERLLHLFIISRGLDYFAHVHPEPAGDGTFRLEHDAPPGEYVVIADFLPQGGTPQMVHRAIVTPGFAGPLFAATRAVAPDIPAGSPRWTAVEHTVDGLRVRLEVADLIGGRRGILRVRLSDESGAPVTDLEPFLGAPAHMLIVNSTLEDAIHGHPEEVGVRGPSVTFLPLLPAPGIYKLWVQFQRKGKVTTVPFLVGAAEP